MTFKSSFLLFDDIPQDGLEKCIKSTAATHRGKTEYALESRQLEWTERGGHTSLSGNRRHRHPDGEEVLAGSTSVIQLRQSAALRIGYRRTSRPHGI